MNPVTSTKNQWYQTTYAAVPQGHYFSWGDLLATAVTDSGQVWVAINEPSHFTEAESWSYIGIASPTGFIRVSGCQWAQNTTSWDAWEDGPLYKRAFYMASEGHHMIPVGDQMYIGIEDNDNRDRWIKVDQNTLQATVVAGGAAQGVGVEPIDGSGVGNVSLDLTTSYSCYKDGHIYWFERGFTPSGASDGRYLFYRLRRMQTIPPYGVETLPNPVLTPTGLTSYTYSDVLDFIFDRQTNGLRNYLRDDVAAAYHYGPYHLADRGDNYLYFGQTNDIRRISLDDWTIETILYGEVDIRHDNYTVFTDRDHLSDFEETPYGAPAGPPTNFESVPNAAKLGIPELEGLDMATSGWQWYDNDRLVFLNNTMFQWGPPRGKFMCTIDVTAIEQRIATSGVPERVNRANPQWETIANGTYISEQQHAWNPIVTGSSTWRDGGNPLMWLAGEIFAVNNNSPLAGKIVFLHHEIGLDLAYNWATRYFEPDRGMTVVAFLEPEPNVIFDVQLSFEGTALQGYAAHISLPHQQAPEVVSLHHAE